MMDKPFSLCPSILSLVSRLLLAVPCFTIGTLIVGSDLNISSLDRSHLERGIDMLGPRMTTLLSTSMTGIISPRLRIHCDDAEDDVGFSALVQRASLFHHGQLLDETFANNQMDIGTGPADPSHYQIA